MSYIVIHFDFLKSFFNGLLTAGPAPAAARAMVVWCPAELPLPAAAAAGHAGHGLVATAFARNTFGFGGVDGQVTT